MAENICLIPAVYPIPAMASVYQCKHEVFSRYKYRKFPVDRGF